MLHLHRHFDQAVLGEVLYAPVAVVLSQSDVVEPDLVVVLAEHASLIRRARIEGAPDLGVCRIGLVSLSNVDNIRPL